MTRGVLAAAATASLLSVGLVACGEDEPTAAPTSADATLPAVTEPGGATSTDATLPSAGEPAPLGTDPDLTVLLADRTFLSVTVEGHSLVDGSQLELRFDGDRLGVAGGCNQLGGTWSVDGDVLTVPEMSMTEMACEPAALMDQDAWVAELLSSGPTVAVDGPTLTLTGSVGGSDVVITFTDREVADPDRPLEETSWTLESLLSADAASSVPAGVRTPTIAVREARIEVFSGCNNGSAPVQVNDTGLELGPLGMTEIACDEASMDVEQQVVGVLDGTVTFAIEADQLTITNGDAGLVFRAAD